MFSLDYCPIVIRFQNVVMSSQSEEQVLFIMAIEQFLINLLDFENVELMHECCPQHSRVGTTINGERSQKNSQDWKPRRENMQTN